MAHDPVYQKLDQDGWCAGQEAIRCVNETYSDIATFDAGRGFPFPAGDGLYAAVARTRSADPQDETALWVLPSGRLRTDHGDSLITYSVVKGAPTAEQVLQSLSLLAEEILEQEPADYPVGYLFMQKFIETTLYISALEDRRDIYTMVERFRDCIQISIMTGEVASLQDRCRSELRP